MTGIIDRVLGALAWACQIGSATLYLAVMFQPVVWHQMWNDDPFSTISIWVFVVGMALLWMLAQYQEQTHFYNRRMRTLYRKGRVLGHGTVLFFAALAAAVQKDRIGLWVVMGMCLLLSLGTWSGWMQTRLLPPEDQAVIDAIHDREAQQAATAYDASEKERRRERLSAIVSSLGYQLTDAQTPAGIQDEPSAIRWQIPNSKHASLVYFIRNGNRMKIGTSTELKRRIRTLALRAENVALLYDGDRRLERQYHSQFADLRIGNTEWFAYEGALAEHVLTETARLTRKDS
jgi:hypothetical protein